MLKIASYRVEELNAVVTKFNKKAAKWNLPQLEVKKSEPFDVEFETEEGFKYFIEFCEVEIIGEIPRIAGWKIHSRVEPSEIPGQNFVFTLPNFEQAPYLRTTKMVCQHCNIDRARGKVYLLQHEETGETKIVGTTCLKDFLPNVDVEKLLSYIQNYASMLAGLEEDEEGSGERAPRSAWLYETKLLIAESLVWIKKNGFVSRKAARESCEELVSTDNFLANTSREREKMYSQAEIAEAYKSGEVDACVNWIETNGKEGDFWYNVRLAVKQHGTPWKLFSFVAAAVNSYIMSKTELVEKIVKNNQYVGTVGERREFHNLTIIREVVVEGTYGNTFITSFEDAIGTSYVWFASKSVGKVGDSVNLKATVREHKEFKGVKQTVLTRGTKI
jgi:hypothetical protein